MSISGDHRPTSGNMLQVTALYQSHLDICHLFLLIKKLPIGDKCPRKDRKRSVFLVCALQLCHVPIFTLLSLSYIGIEMASNNTRVFYFINGNQTQTHPELRGV